MLPFSLRSIISKPFSGKNMEIITILSVVPSRIITFTPKGQFPNKRGNDQNVLHLGNGPLLAKNLLGFL